MSRFEHLTTPSPASLDPIVGAYLDASKTTDKPYPEDAHPLPRKDVIDVLKHLWQLEDSIQKMKVECPTERRTSTHLKALENSALALRNMVISMLRHDLLACIPSATSPTKANEVFAIPELCEKILVQLSAKELLSSMLVIRAFAKTIAATPSLLRILDVRPEASCPWRSNFISEYYSGSDATFDSMLECDLMDRGSFQHYGDGSIMGMGEIPYEHIGIRVRVPPEFKSFRSTDINAGKVRIGSRPLSMLICQPPILAMRAVPNCCLYGNSDVTTVTITSSTGITLVDVLDAAVKIMHDHSNCPYAESRYHNYDGVVNVTVELAGHMFEPSLAPIPALVHQHTLVLVNHPEPDREDSVYCTEMGRLLDAFVDAKQVARLTGVRIPTFIEFRNRAEAQDLVRKVESEAYKRGIGETVRAELVC